MTDKYQSQNSELNRGSTETLLNEVMHGQRGRGIHVLCTITWSQQTGQTCFCTSCQATNYGTKIALANPKEPETSRSLQKTFVLNENFILL